MYDGIIEYLSNKSVAILGFGMEGISTYKFIRKHLPNKELTIIDKNDVRLKNSFLEVDKLVDYVFGEDYLDNLDKYDVIIKSPGISLNDIDISAIKENITSQYDLLSRFKSDNIIGITGTKGKSTTTSMIFQVLRANNKKALLLGNIGIPIFDYIDDIDEETILVIELSAYQLEFVHASPKYSIILNLYEEHLNFFNTLDKYYNSKLNIFRHQNSGDYGLFTTDCEDLNNRLDILKGNRINITFNKDLITDETVYCDEKEVFYVKNCIWEKIYAVNDKRNLIGKHNLYDIMFVLGIAKIFGLDLRKTVEAINSFKGLEHRMEFVGEFDGIKYYDDAIATIPEATINAIKSIGNVDTVIIGGLDRGINYDLLVNFLATSSVSNILCMRDSGYKMGHMIESIGTTNNIYYVEDMEEAVNIAMSKTKKGHSCLLSPSSPSYNVYKNFEEKGDHFKKIVRNEE